MRAHVQSECVSRGVKRLNTFVNLWMHASLPAPCSVHMGVCALQCFGQHSKACLCTRITLSSSAAAAYTVRLYFWRPSPQHACACLHAVMQPLSQGEARRRVGQQQCGKSVAEVPCVRPASRLLVRSLEPELCFSMCFSVVCAAP